MTYTNILEKLWSDKDGNIGMMAAIGLPAVLAASALAIETNILFEDQSSLQSALDAATLAAASTGPQSRDAIASEVFDLAVGDTNIDFGNNSVTLSRDGDFLVGTVEGTIDTVFGGVLMPSTISVHAVTRVGFYREVGSTPEGDTVEAVGTRACIIALRDRNEGLILNSGARITAPECEVHVHSTNNAVNYNNGAGADIKKLCIQGSSFGANNGRGANALDPSQIELNCTVAQDPYVGAYPEVDTSSCDFTAFDPRSLGSRKNRDKMQPGVYCGQGRDVKFDSGTYEMEPGLYVIKDSKWQIGNGDDLIGEGVTIYFDNSSIIEFSNSGNLDISAPTTGEYANFVMVEKPGLRNSNRLLLNGGNHINLDGIVHIPSRDVTLNSGSRSTSTALIANQIIVNSGARLTIEPKNYFPAVPGEIYEQVPVSGAEGEGVGTEAGNGVGTEAGDGTDRRRVASSDGTPYIAQ